MQELEKSITFAPANDKLRFVKVGAIAQLVEQRTENPCVPGSIPGGTTQINTPIEMIIFQWEYLFTPTPPIPSNML